MHTFSRAQHVVSTIICRCSRSSGVGGDFGVRQGEFVGGQAPLPAHEPYRHIGTLPRSSGVAVAERVFPVLLESAGYRNAGATSLSSLATGNQVLALVRWPLSHSVKRPPAPGRGDRDSENQKNEIAGVGRSVRHCNTSVSERTQMLLFVRKLTSSIASNAMLATTKPAADHWPEALRQTRVKAPPGGRVVINDSHRRTRRGN